MNKKLNLFLKRLQKELGCEVKHQYDPERLVDVFYVSREINEELYYVSFAIKDWVKPPKPRQVAFHVNNALSRI